MVRLLGSDPTDISKEIHVTKGDHAKHTYLQRHFKTFLPHIADYTEEGNEDETVSEYVWGPSALTFLYKGLSATTAPSVSTVIGYMTLLQAWIYHYFPTLCARLEGQSYDETMHGANKYSPISGQPSISSKRLSLDRLLRSLWRMFAFTLAGSDVEAPRPCTSLSRSSSSSVTHGAILVWLPILQFQSPL
ncbi:hypothetical protein P8452_56408 [Trifolium repens]|nr:hypothetical protein P8452_56408 [Trifolium repens]